MTTFAILPFFGRFALTVFLCVLFSVICVWRTSPVDNVAGSGHGGHRDGYSVGVGMSRSRAVDAHCGKLAERMLANMVAVSG